MKGTTAIYKGRIVDKKVFRTFIYGADGQKKLVESWEAFEASMQSGLWFATRKDAKESMEQAKAKPKPKPRPKPNKPKAVKVEEVEQDDDLDLDGLDDQVFEVTDETK